MKEPPSRGRSRARGARGACPAQGLPRAGKSPRYWARACSCCCPSRSAWSPARSRCACSTRAMRLPPNHPPREARAGWPTYRRSSDPDTGKEHYVIRNNLDGRQSRNFGAANLDGAVNIGFFGDSQTENFLMPAQYSYTEPLDYLLNLGPLPRPGGQDARFNVLNFGVRGTGTGRAYLRWRGLPVRRQLAHVFYMVSSNDLGDLGKAIRAGIVRLGESGAVLAGGPAADAAVEAFACASASDVPRDRCVAQGRRRRVGKGSSGGAGGGLPRRSPVRVSRAGAALETGGGS